MTAPVYATYVGSPPMVKAAQLTQETADAVCRWTLGHRLTADRWIPQEGCWRVSAQRWYPDDRWPPDRFIIGIRTRQGEQIAYRGDWIVQNGGGAFAILRPEDFAGLYQALPAEGRDR